ncbi:class I SAM-dependent methyltransferase [Herbaspirillum sp. RV1423]|uniref:class I SAM-dependent methyltransferase n=1 Tax=Herbaspirillum sp. RV1423 TaxID=1443993 RepID=UPI0012DE540A|nr:class I SAM-dependent methyltransferase [Herbaspirillum sp. RV1423]
MEQLAEELASRMDALPPGGNPLHSIFYKRGFHLLRKHFYLPIPDDIDQLETFWGRPSAMVGVDTNDVLALNVMETICPEYLGEFRERFPIDGPLDPPDFYLINGGYMAVDAHVYYCMIRHFKPKRIVEIGNGNSTLLAIAACTANKGEGSEIKLTSIDPYPWPLFKDGYPGLDELIVKRVQDVPLSYFEELEAGDILFIDSSHVIRSGNDVHYEFLEILPRLKPGVLVHVHDISLPKPYPEVYFQNQLYWNEQYLLQAFLIHNSRFEVVWPGNYLMENYPERMLKVFPEFEIMRKHYPLSEPSAFWMRVKEG